MKIFRWFDTSEVDALAGAMAAELITRVPPSRLESHDKKAADRLWNTHEAIFTRAAKFARTKKLNIYTKARFANQFRWALKEAGYPAEFVDSWTYELIALVARNPAARKESC